MLSCIPCPSQAKGQRKGSLFSPSCLQLVTLPLSLSHFVKWALGPTPFFKADIYFEAGEERQRSGPLPLEQTLLLGLMCFFACLFPTFDAVHVSATFPLQGAIWRVGDLLSTVTGLWDSDYLA